MGTASRSQRARAGFAGPRPQAGAAAVFVAISLVGLLMAMSFALDLGQLYSARADLRKQADLAALDAVSAAGGCLSPEDAEQRFGLASAAVNQSLSKNSGVVTPDHTLALGVERIQGVRRAFSSTDPATNAHAASVQLTRALPPALLPLYPRPQGAVLRATGEATRAPTVVFRVGSFVADLDASDVPLLNSILAGPLGEDPGLSLVSYQGLLESSLALGDIVNAAAVQSLQTLLSEPVTLRGLLSLLADTLIDTGDAVAATALQTLEDAAPNTPPIPFAEMAGLPPDLFDTAQGARIQTFDLVRNAVLQASPVFQLTPDVELPAGLVSVSALVELIRPPQQGVGPVLRDESGNYVTTANNQQANVGLNLGIQPLGLPLANLGLELVAADATATLVQTHCASADNMQQTVDLIAETRLATLRIRDDVPILSLSIPLPIIGNVGAQVFASAEASVGSDQVYGPQRFYAPFSDTDPDIIAANTWTVSSPLGASVSNLVGDLADSLELDIQVDLPVLGPLVAAVVMPVLNGVLSTVLNTLNPLLESVLLSLDVLLLEQLLSTLGLSLGGADITVYAFDVPPPTLIASY